MKIRRRIKITMSCSLMDLLAGGAWRVEDWQTWLFVPALVSFCCGFVSAPSGPSRCRAARSLHLAVVIQVAQHLLPLPDHVEVKLGED